jgi:hypothetical protein
LSLDKVKIELMRRWLVPRGPAASPGADRPLHAAPARRLSAQRRAD